MIAQITGRTLPEGVIGISTGSNYIIAQGLMPGKTLSKVNCSTVFLNYNVTTYSPYFLVHGRHPKLPLDLDFELPPEVPVKTADYISRVME